MVGDVLSEFYDSDGYEENRKVSDCRAVKLFGYTLFECFKECEFRIIEETLEFYGREAFLYRSEIYNLHRFNVCRETYAGDENCEYETRADTYDEGDKSYRLSAFRRSDYDWYEGYETDEYVPETVFRSAVIHHPVSCRSRKGKTDDCKDGSDDYVGKEFFNPARTDEFDYKSEYDVNKTCKRNADNQTPVTVVLSCGSGKRAEESEGRAEEYGASESCEQKVYDSSCACSEKCRGGIANEVDAYFLCIWRNDDGNEQSCRHDCDHLLEREH